MAIMKTRRGNQLLISGKQKLEITDTGIRTEALFCNKQITAFTPYKKIDQIYLINTKSSSDLAIISAEQGTIRLKALQKDEAKKVKDHIELIDKGGGVYRMENYHSWLTLNVSITLNSSVVMERDFLLVLRIEEDLCQE